jgi:hypothetical protein
MNRLASMLVLLAAACGPSPSVPDGGDSGPDRADATPDAAPRETTGPCHELSLDGAATVALASRSEAPPAPSGGELRDGTYELSSATQYRASGPAIGLTLRSRLTITAGVAQEVIELGGSVQRWTWAVTTQGTTASFERTCPRVAGESSGRTQEYTASGSELLLFNGQAPNGSMLVQTYTRR